MSLSVTAVVCLTAVVKMFLKVFQTEQKDNEHLSAVVSYLWLTN